EADVPGQIAWVGDATRKGRDGIEGAGRAELPVADVSRERSADAVHPPGRRRDEGHVARVVDAVGAGIEHRRRTPDAAAEIEIVVYGVGALAVKLVEAEILLDDVAVRQRHKSRATAAQRCRVEALTIRIVVVPEAAIEREFAERRTDAAVDVDLGGGAVGEVDALAGNAGIGLEVGVDVVARLEAHRGR